MQSAVFINRNGDNTVTAGCTHIEFFDDITGDILAGSPNGSTEALRHQGEQIFTGEQTEVFNDFQRRFAAAFAFVFDLAELFIQTGVIGKTLAPDQIQQ